MFNALWTDEDKDMATDPVGLMDNLVPGLCWKQDDGSYCVPNMVALEQDGPEDLAAALAVSASLGLFCAHCDLTRRARRRRASVALP